jgi:hypothetical protein
MALDLHHLIGVLHPINNSLVYWRCSCCILSHYLPSAVYIGP